METRPWKAVAAIQESKAHDGAGGSPTKSKKNNENTKNPALNPSFVLDKRTRSGQPAKASELKLGCCLCGFPYILSTSLISRSEVWHTALGANDSRLLFLQLKTESRTTLVIAAVGWIASSDHKTWLDMMGDLCMVID